MEQRIGWDVALASLSLAFALSVVIAWTYSLSYAGLSYLRSFTQSIAISGVISAAMMLAVGDEVARGLGLVGALTIVRFRTTLKDTRDLMFIFAALASGVACGVQSYVVGISGVGVFSLAVLLLSRSDFGSHRQYDAVLRLRLPSDAPPPPKFNELLEQHCRRVVLVNVRQAGAHLSEHAFHVEFADPGAGGVLVRELNALPGLSGVTLLMQDSTVEQ